MTPLDFWALSAFTVTAILVVAATMALSHFVGQRHHQDATGEPYESGIVSTGSAELQLSAKFYLVAMLFVIFDLEAVFLFAWAIAVVEVGWVGFWGAAAFIAILLVGLVYEWREGTFDFGPRPRAERPRTLSKPSRPETRLTEERDRAFAAR